MSPHVAVVICVYNQESLVSRAIDSVLGQTYRSGTVRIVIVDDGSTDKTPDVLRSYNHLHQLKVIRQSNMGPAAARNRAFRELVDHAPDFVAFLDADDYWLPTRLEELLREAAREPRSAWTTNAYLEYVDEEGGTLSDELYIKEPGFYMLSNNAQRELLRSQNPVFTMQLVPWGPLDSVGGFDERLHYGEDWDLWIRLAASGVTFRLLDRPLAVYTIRSDSLTRSKRLDQCLKRAESVLRILSKYGAEPRDLALMKGSIEYLRFRCALHEHDVLTAISSGVRVVRNLPFIKDASLRRLTRLLRW